MVFFERTVGVKHQAHVTSDCNHVEVPSRFAHASEVDIETLAVVNLGQGNTVDDFGHRLVVRNITLEAILRTVAELAVFHAALLGGHGNDKLVRDIDRTVFYLFDLLGVAEEVGLDVVFLAVVAHVQVFEFHVGVGNDDSGMSRSNSSH